MFNLSKYNYIKKRLTYNTNLFFSHFEKPIITISNILDIVCIIAAANCLMLLTVYLGYNLKPSDHNRIWTILRVTQGLFVFATLFNLIFRYHTTLKQNKIIKWIVDMAVLLSAVPWIYPAPMHPWLPWLKAILYSPKFLLFTLGAYSLVNLCYSLSRIPNRRTNPSIIMALSFLIFILLGSFVLMLPRCTYHGISYFDSLFVASSAVCITGLSSVDIPTTFTPFGVLVLSVLVQLGSLGIITFTSFFALFFTGSTSIYNQLLLKDMIYSKSMNSLVPTLIYVLSFTITVELIGAVVVFFTVPDAFNMTINERILFSAFHSMSSFCNAGFSCLPDGMSNPILMESNQLIYVVTSVLIFAGAIGFPILVNFKEIIKYYIKKIFTRGGKTGILPVHIFDLNTKIVLWTTLSILVLGSIAFLLLEYDNTLQGMSFGKKVIQSIFNALIPRSAGFASVNPSDFLDITIVIILVQMIIGGSSQSMAGGIKVNTLGAVLLNMRSVILGHEGASAFNRRINVPSIRRAHTVVSLAAISLFVYLIVVMLLEPHLPTKSLIFEVISALFTVGSSLGITPQLSNCTKVVLCTAMFLGRVGLISLLCGIMTTQRDISPHLPSDNIIIN